VGVPDGYFLADHAANLGLVHVAHSQEPRARRAHGNGEAAMAFDQGSESGSIGLEIARFHLHHVTDIDAVPPLIGGVNIDLVGAIGPLPEG